MKVTEKVTRFAQKLQLAMPDNLENVPPYKPAVLRDYGGDTSKRWLVEFYAFDHSEEKLKRKITIVPKNLGARDRRKWAKERIDLINRLLSQGYSVNLPKKSKAHKSGSAELVPSMKPLKTVLKEMLELITAELRALTAKDYKTCLRQFEEFAQENGWDTIPIKDLERPHVMSYLDSMTLRGLSARTYNNHLVMIRRIGNRLIERGIIDKNFTDGISKRSVEAAANTPYTAEQQAMLEAWAEKNNRGLLMVIKLIYYAFLRPVEITRLKVGDFNFKDRNIRCLSTTTKTKKSYYQPISKQLLDFLLQEGVDKMDKSFFLVGDGIKLIPSHKHTIRTRLSDANLRMLRDCKLDGKGLSLYSWRDTGVVNAYKAGIDIKTLQSLLQHHSLAMTEIYLGSLGLQVKDNIEGLEW